jgi:hypothetical protein
MPLPLTTGWRLGTGGGSSGGGMRPAPSDGGCGGGAGMSLGPALGGNSGCPLIGSSANGSRCGTSLTLLEAVAPSLYPKSLRFTSLRGPPPTRVSTPDDEGIWV